ncbi:WhiB family transcriptional regulator [Rhodococcus jostii]|uniref:Transcriptional regulator WhiB n=1 Tax=Rhodococcus jostii TaxID=132919 RepID=A0ABU4CI11_RHOJO|nr:WhiB family transcriptional regulator [Rhodococcus jostii]MDV6283098.1 WhiB family transcriptional regulator [Rhodococcus jostii]
MPDHFHHSPDRDWQHRASCRGTDTNLFFSPDGERGHDRARRERAAKQICQDCPVLERCRAHALTATETYGIWGGMSETERTRHTRRTRVPARRRDATHAPAPHHHRSPCSRT